MINTDGMLHELSGNLRHSIDAHLIAQVKGYMKDRIQDNVQMSVGDQLWFQLHNQLKDQSFGRSVND